MLNQKALELLDFVSDGKVRYPGYNAELFGDNVQVEKISRRILVTSVVS